jgi:hypothetical protein
MPKRKGPRDGFVGNPCGNCQPEIISISKKEIVGKEKQENGQRNVTKRNICRLDPQQRIHLYERKHNTTQHNAARGNP